MDPGSHGQTISINEVLKQSERESLKELKGKYLYSSIDFFF